eukprot:14136823-Alexandrium_andersonii.AAC.1
MTRLALGSALGQRAASAHGLDVAGLGVSVSPTVVWHTAGWHPCERLRSGCAPLRRWSGSWRLRDH